MSSSHVKMSDTAAAGFILLKDEVGFKYDGIVKHTFKKIFGGAHSKVNVLQGELVEEYNIPEAKYNYVLHRDQSIFLNCRDEDVAPLFQREEFLLLKGIEKVMDRLQAFTEGKLELAKNLHQNVEIYVVMFEHGYSKKTWAKSVIRFRGEVNGLPGIQFGLEILEENTGIGNTDGTFNNHHYFRCKDGYGIFVSLDKLSETKPFLKQSSTQERALSSKITDMDYPANNTRSRNKPQRSRRIDSKVGDRVRFYNKNGDSFEGVVKWVGDSTGTKEFDYVHVGIQTDEDIFIQDFDQSMPGLGYLIEDIPKLNRLFLPESLVDKIEGKRESKGLEASITSKMAKEVDRSRDEFINEQSKYFEEYKAKKQQEELNQLKSAGVTDEEVTQQAEALRRIEEESQQHKEVGGFQDRKHYPQHTDADRHREMDQFKATYDSHKQGKFGDHLNFDEDNYPRSGHSINRSFSNSSNTVSCVDKQFEEDSKLASTGFSPSMDIVKGSMIQLPSTDKGAHQYGVVRWIGNIPNVTGLVAGIELDEAMDGCTDGSWISPNGRTFKFFTCAEGKALYYPLNKLTPDMRVSGMGNSYRNPLADVPEIVTQDDLTVTVNSDIMHYVGVKKGIQGHQNSCYLDSTVFGLFALSHEFDEMFLRDRDSRVGQILWQKIVNPLRKFGVVKYESVMELRKELDQLGQMSGITHAEKDPEEFLNLMFKSSLKVQPFISIRRPFGIESEYFVQLFVELSDSPKPAFIGSLLNEMFLEQNIRFTQVPSKLLIQVPRHGKKFQSFQKIIPELTLNVSKVTDSVFTGLCFFCGQQKAAKICEDCYGELNSKSPLAYCNDCFRISHSVIRTDHNPKPCDGGTAELELLSVLCIETSHYVCFTRRDYRWLFFDSMSDRQCKYYCIYFSSTTD